MALNIIINKVSVAASFAAGATVATAVASGGTAPYVYSLATGGDKFAINSSTGVITTIAAMDITNIASFSVTATDSTTGTALTITSDVIYPPIQAAIRSKFDRTNVIYKITKDIDLGHGVLTIPAGCTLDFQGGSFTNGTIILDDTVILAGERKIFSNITLSGTAKSSIIIEWFLGTESDMSPLINKVLNFNLNTPIVFTNTYPIAQTITIPSNAKIDFRPSALFKATAAITAVVLNSNIKIDHLNISYPVTSALHTTGVGLHITGFDNLLHDVNIEGFGTGLLFYNSNGACAYNNVEIGKLKDCVIYLSMKCDGTSGYTNENIVHGGRFQISNSLKETQTTYGIIIQSSENQVCNGNKFIGCCLEGLKRNVTVISGQKNIFEGLRIESHILEWYYNFNKQTSQDSADNIVISGYNGGGKDIPVMIHSQSPSYTTDSYKGNNIYLGSGYSVLNGSGKVTYLQAGSNENFFNWDGNNQILYVNGKVSAYFTQSGFACINSTSTNRPTTGLRAGVMYFDTTLGKPIWYNGSAWIDATGAAV